MQSSYNRQLGIWLLSGCILIFVMVIIGGITRLTGSGLSIVEWNLIMGVFPPLSDDAWNTVFEDYKQFPQYRMVNYEITLSDFKSIFWWEYIHRLWGRMLGFAFAIPFVIFLFQKKINKKLLKKLLLIFFLGALQGIIGWWMVKSGLINKPQVSAYRLTAHLVLALILYAYTFIIALQFLSDTDSSSNNNNSSLRMLSKIITGAIFLQIILGGFMAGLKAGAFYPTFPKIKGEWIPDGMWVITPLWKNLFENITTVHFFHRYLGISLFLAILFFCYHAFKTQRLRINILLLLIVVSFQIVLGIFTLIYSVPVHLAILHQTTALILLTISLFINHKLNIQHHVNNPN